MNFPLNSFKPSALFMGHRQTVQNVSFCLDCFLYCPSILLHFTIYNFTIACIKVVLYVCNRSWNRTWRRNEPQHEISNNVVGATSKGSDQSVHTHSLIRAFASRLNIPWMLNYWPYIILSFKALKKAAQARLSLLLSKCHIVGNHMSRLKW